MNNTTATRSQRFLAALVDGIPLVVLGVLFSRHLLSDALRPIVLLLELGYIVLQFVLVSNSGQTIGKKVEHIRIVDVQTGQNGGFVTNVLKRWILNGVLCFVPFYALVDILFIFREDRRCIHDLIAGTQVVQVS